MRKNKMMLKKKRSLKAKQLTEKRAKAKQLRAEADELEEKLDAVEDEIPADLETQIQEITDQQDTLDEEIGALVEELTVIDDELAAIEADLQTPSDEEDLTTRSRRPGSSRAVLIPGATFRSRSGCFRSRSERDAFYGDSSVKTFLQRVRALPTGQTRRATGAELGIPVVMLDLLRDNLHQYSKLLPHVRLRPVSGKSRQNIVGKIPEGIWMEMKGALNELDFMITDVETDGYKVGGFIPIDNYILQDSDIALGEEIMYMLGQSIGYALDKGMVFGLGRNSHMPVGIVTRLAQTEQPAYWGDGQGDWTDLHSSNVLRLNLAASEGTAFFVPFLGACAKAKPTYTTDGKIWIMNDATRQDVQIRALAFNANAALMSGIENAMPVVGGEIITLEFMPDHMVVGGYAGEYLLVEREGGTFASSDAPMFLHDKTVFKGTARYDGQPVSGEAFVAFTYDNTAPLIKMAFATDYVNTSPNALIVTSAADGSGTTKLTVAGAVNASNKLMAFIGAPAAIAKGDVPDKDWVEIKSGATAVTAKTGMGATVVELDDKGKVISIGYCSSVTAGT